METPPIKNFTAEETDSWKCFFCGCTNDNCSACIEATGVPCSWVGPNQCSACVEREIDLQGLDLNEQYRRYLERMGMDESRMHPTQKRQVKQAFFGAIGQLLILFAGDFAYITNRSAPVALKLLNHQIQYFWQQQLDAYKDFNAKMN
jgi:hypothetical protein